MKSLLWAVSELEHCGKGTAAADVTQDTEQSVPPGSAWSFHSPAQATEQEAAGNQGPGASGSLSRAWQGLAETLGCWKSVGGDSHVQRKSKGLAKDTEGKDMMLLIAPWLSSKSSPHHTHPGMGLLARDGTPVPSQAVLLPHSWAASRSAPFHFPC